MAALMCVLQLGQAVSQIKENVLYIWRCLVTVHELNYIIDYLKVAVF